MNIGEAYDRYQRELIQYLQRHFCGREMAQDAVQQAFSKAITSLPYIADMPDAALRAWLYAAARNAAIDALRRDGRYQYGVDLEQVQKAQPDETDAVILREEMARLSQMQRELLAMRYGHGYNSSEIAREWGLASSTVRYHLANTLHTLRERMKEEES